MDIQDKVVLFLISNSLTENECRSFRAKNLSPNEKYFLVKTNENKGAKRKDRRASYAVGRLPRENETVSGNRRAEASVNELVEI